MFVVIRRVGIFFQKLKLKKMKFGVAVLILFAFAALISIGNTTPPKETKVINVKGDTTIYISKEELMDCNMLIINN